MSSPDVPDLRRGGLLGLLITGSLWLKLFVGGGLVILGALSLRDEPRTALLLIAFGMAVGFPAALWLRRD